MREMVGATGVWGWGNRRLPRKGGLWSLKARACVGRGRSLTVRVVRAKLVQHM